MNHGEVTNKENGPNDQLISKQYKAIIDLLKLVIDRSNVTEEQLRALTTSVEGLRVDVKGIEKKAVEDKAIENSTSKWWHVCITILFAVVIY